MVVGKAMASDAIRWVLGESNIRQLRAQSGRYYFFRYGETRSAYGFG